MDKNRYYRETDIIANCITNFQTQHQIWYLILAGVFRNFQRDYQKRWERVWFSTGYGLQWLSGVFWGRI